MHIRCCVWQYSESSGSVTCQSISCLLINISYKETASQSCSRQKSSDLCMFAAQRIKQSLNFHPLLSHQFNASSSWDIHRPFPDRFWAPPPVFPSLLALFCDVSFSPCRYLEMDVFTEKGSRVEGMGGPRERGAGLILINDCLALRRFSQWLKLVRIDSGLEAR